MRKHDRLIRRLAVTPLILLATVSGGVGVAYGTDGVYYGGGETFDTATAVTADSIPTSRSGYRNDLDADSATTSADGGGTDTDDTDGSTDPTGSDTGSDAGSDPSAVTGSGSGSDTATGGESDADAGSVTVDGDWTMGDADTTGDSLTRIQADNQTVETLINDRDWDDIPDGFDPNHDTGDTGNAYSFSQCTWWVYVRRHQLDLPVGSYFGNGAQWADSARELGYWVDNTPRVGDIMVFTYGQDGASAIYGHVAVVETVGEDGSITTSECGTAYNGVPFTRTFTAEQAAEHEFIHY